ncbi:alpha-galactosidase [Anaerocolumna sedimenticola]|uniref:Alpha-galactosidase n=1 Tax=Anaerocolumna sedimenticola TaxID=2696063 RepID=A0A6P1TL05_9FIRM|nr:alpha-galactosidase [Anaerocolumna sedimenticola]QHQ61734.1 alpha-galactosidase [Anaerocolumna sedimenticola]
MPILYHEQSKEFHLYNKEISYIIEIMEDNQLGNLYYGKKVIDRDSFAHLHEEMKRSQAASHLPEPSKLYLQYTKQEYPSYGTGDYRYPAFEIKQNNGSRISHFEYIGHNIYKGKKKIEPLPAVYVEEEGEADSLEIELFDELTNTRLLLFYTIYAELPVITRSAKFIQEGTESICLTNAMSASIDLPDMDFEMLHLAGAWARERYVKLRKLEQGVQSVYSMRGASSTEHNPFLALKRPEATEHTGEVYGFSLVYSGSFLAQVEVCTHDMTRVLFGIHPNNFEWPLNTGESFQTPEVVMVYSDQGLNKMSQTYHKLYRTRLVRGKWRDKARPVLLNNWEATYMDFNEESILKIAEKAKSVGVELFVLDDGWFGTRDDDKQSLGDWFVDKRKLPNGISGLSEKIEAMGMKFGLWIEPEMTNKNSDLYRNHPDYIISVPGRFESLSRTQHVLDFSRKEIVDYIHSMIAGIIRESKISYIKWDMNRYITECYSRAALPEEQGMVMHKYILGVYDLYTRLITEFPDILFESCASGGGRFDPGMLYFAPQTWCSDDTDANERLKIQYGTSMVYPLSSIGAHVSAVPNHQLGRLTPIQSRANVAFFGAFGYELDLNKLTEEEIEAVKEQVRYYKENRSLIQQGNFYRLKSPFEGNDTAWIVVSDDKSKAIAGYYQRLNKVNASWLRLQIKGLDESTLYQVSSLGKTMEAYGDELMNIGIIINRKDLNRTGGDFASLLFDFVKVK